MCCRRPSSPSARRRRRSGSCQPIAGCRRRPATSFTDGVAYPADWIAIIFNPSFPYRFAHMLNAAYLTTGFVVLAVGARYLARRPPCRGGAHHAAHGDRPDRDARAAATPASAISTASTRSSTSRPRSPPWRRIGTAASPATSTSSPGRTRTAERQSLRDFHPARLLADPDARYERPVSRGLKSVPPDDRPPVILVFFAFRIMLAIGFFMIGRGVVRRLSVVARNAV